MDSGDPQSSYDFNVLYEKASSEDLFEDKPHEKVSSTIYKIMEKTETGITIGLEGSWGSGKSTVINLLRNMLDQNPHKKTLFYMFDAWAHDGDPLRKIFLESLILAIDPKEEDTVLTELKNEISARKKRVDVNTTKTASKLGKYLSASVLAIPIGAALLSAVDFDSVLAPWNELSNGPHWLLWIGSFFALLPALTLLTWFFFGDKKNGKRIWDVFESTAIENYTQDITEDGERTSIEFEKYFARILDYILGGNDRIFYDRAVIVIDNLDRVEPEHAKNIWSTLQTYFQHRSSNEYMQNTWSKRLWFVVPFDRVGLSKVWQASQNEHSTDNQHDGLASSFFGKCFQLIAAVPEPVMSAWVEYLEVCIGRSLIGWPLYQQKEISETYQRFASNLEQSPTPRKIQLIINQIGMYGTAWGGEVSAEAICLYSILRQERSERELRAHLLQQGLPDNYQSSMQEAELKAELAGLLFGVPKEKGIQLLLAPEIHTALRNGDGARLKDMVETYDRAFWIAWQAKKSDWLLADSHNDEYKIAFTKAIHDGIPDYITNLHHEIQNIVTIWKNSADGWRLDHFDYSQPMSQLIRILDQISGSESFTDWLENCVSKKTELILQKLGKPDFRKEELPNLKKLMSLLEDAGYHLKPISHKNLTPKNWKEWVEAQSSQETTIETVRPAEGIIEHLSAEANFSLTTPDREPVDILRHTLLVSPDSHEWKAVIDSVLSWTSIPNRDTSCDYVYILCLEMIATLSDDVTSRIRKSASSAKFWQCYATQSIQPSHVLAIFAALSCRDTLQDNPHVSSQTKEFWHKAQDDKVQDEIFELLTSLKELRILWILAKDNRNILATSIIRRKIGASLFSLTEGAMSLHSYKWLSSEEMAEYAKHFCHFGAFHSNVEDMTGNTHLYQSVFSLFNQFGDKQAKSFIKSEINNISTEEWNKYLLDCSALLNCINSKNHKFSDALINYLIDIIGGKIVPDDWILSKLDILISRTVDTEVVVLPKVCETYFESLQDNLNDASFNAIAPHMNSSIETISPQKYMTRINEWIDKKLHQRIRWLLSQDIQQPTSPLESLVERVKESLSTSDSDDKPLFEEINSRLGLMLPATDRDPLSEEKGG